MKVLNSPDHPSKFTFSPLTLSFAVLLTRSLPCVVPSSQIGEVLQGSLAIGSAVLGMPLGRYSEWFEGSWKTYDCGLQSTGPRGSTTSDELREDDISIG